MQLYFYIVYEYLGTWFPLILSTKTACFRVSGQCLTALMHSSLELNAPVADIFLCKPVVHVITV